ncbi:carbamoyl-phosphate synthase (glutamine-hydrolyzing) cpa2 [Ascosphaera aggregata]|nr:carbamoyl-phosphate synthase (glutamine-hydrolyzing) cpa2 [Ascosphaera aggregata]
MLHENYTVDRVHELTKIDKWFLYKLQNIVGIHKDLTAVGNLETVRHELMLDAKKYGFSDKQISLCLNTTEDEVRAKRQSLGIRPWVKKIDTLAAEFPADTNYLYTTYNASSHDIDFEDKGIIILGSGVYRIGSSVEFDWCAVNATLSLRKMGNKTVMINYNPETYSTDFDTADRLYFEELSYERVMDIYELENASGVVVSVGGQLPQNIALRLQETGGAKVLGTDPKDIDKAEDRHKFSQILDSIGVDQPAWKELTSVEEAEQFAEAVTYPVLVRPSYVLSGAAMSVIRSKDELKTKLLSASNVSPDHPVVITKFIEGAQEIDVDAVASEGRLIIHAVSEHVEAAGVHSGDATLVLPSYSLDEAVVRRVKEIAEKVAKAWNITGPFNMQIIKADKPDGAEPELKVIECNLRASRSFPFVSKVLGVNFIDVATKAISGQNVPEPQDLMAVKRDYLATKVPQFSWTRLAGADPYLGVEMASTGEIACFGKNLVEAYWASLQSTMNFRLPEPGEGILLGGDISSAELAKIADYLYPLQYKFYAASPEIKKYIESASKNAITVEVIEFPKTDKRALREVFEKKDIRGVFNLAKARGRTLLDQDYIMRRNAVDFGVPLFMEPKTALLFAQCMSEKLPRKEGIPSEVRTWSDFTGNRLIVMTPSLRVAAVSFNQKPPTIRAAGSIGVAFSLHSRAAAESRSSQGMEMSTSNIVAEKAPATTLSLVVATALIAGVTGYFIGKGASIGLFCSPPDSRSTGEAVKAGEKRESSDEDEWEDGSEEDGDGCDEEAFGALASFDNNKDDVKLVLVVRTDLGMTKGKIAAQCSHATLACYKTLVASLTQRSLLSRWEGQGQPKIALQVKSEDDLLMLQAQAMSLGLCARVIRDAGRTQIASGSMTVLGILGPRSIVDGVTGNLKLL